MPYFEPVILFFLLGAFAGFVRSDLKIPGVLYESLSIFLLLAIGLKGGVELARYRLLDVALPALAVVAVGALIPLAAFPVLRGVGKLSRAMPDRSPRTTGRSAWSPSPSARPTWLGWARPSKAT
jgi:uncharacterized protein